MASSPAECRYRGLDSGPARRADHCGAEPGSDRVSPWVHSSGIRGYAEDPRTFIDALITRRRYDFSIPSTRPSLRSLSRHRPPRRKRHGDRRAISACRPRRWRGDDDRSCAPRLWSRARCSAHPHSDHGANGTSRIPIAEGVNYPVVDPNQPRTCFVGITSGDHSARNADLAARRVSQSRCHIARQCGCSYGYWLHLRGLDYHRFAMVSERREACLLFNAFACSLHWTFGWPDSQRSGVLAASRCLGLRYRLGGGCRNGISWPASPRVHRQQTL